ncbi:MAG: hypothetical protein IPL46_26830 [Saprospiraceae bacterium]|nr:hypothetical protein [Saprospiraceae bacterium]
MTGPTVEEIYAYRKYVDKAMGQLLDTEPANDIKNLILLGLNHEQQHQNYYSPI